MPAKRSRLGRGDKIVVTSPYGSRLGTYDLTTGEVSDVAPAFRDTFAAELDEWLARNGGSPFPGFGPAGAPLETPSRRTRMTSRLSDTLGFPRLSDAPTGETPTAPPAPAPRAIEAGVAAPAGGWSADSADGFRADAFEDTASHAEAASRGSAAPDRRLARGRDLARHMPDHGLARSAARARAAGDRELDKTLRLQADARITVAQSLAREIQAPVSSRLGRTARWRMLHGIDMTVGSERVVLDHLVLCPGGVFVLEDRHQPGGKVHTSTSGLEVDGQHVDLARIRTIGEEVHDRIAEAIALAAGAQELLNPPPVTPVIVVVGATIVTHSRPRGVIVTRPGDLGRALRTRGERMTPAAVEETYAVARRPDTWE